VDAKGTDQPPSTDSTASPLAVDVRRFPWVRPFVADYAFQFSSVAPFFAGDPHERAAWADAIARTQACRRARTDLKRILEAQLTRRQASARAMEAARRLEDERTVTIVTGQQAGLFGGPTFTLLKAITALKLADCVTRKFGVPAVAVFWIEGEDHDWNEVRTCTVLDADLAPRAVSLPPRAADDSTPVARIQLDNSIDAALAALETTLPATEFRDQMLADLRGAYPPGRGMADAFGHWLERVLGAHGLVVYDSSDPESKPLVRHIFERELTTPGVTARLARDAGAGLAERGYHAQVVTQDDTLALFHLDGGRLPIRSDGERFLVGDRAVPVSAFADQARANPASFSPNVLLRPVVQDTLFPTACYVAGPNELAYLGQLRGIYEHFGIPMPVMYPRVSATILDSAAMRFLTRNRVNLETLQAQDEAALNELLKAQMPPAVEQAFGEAGSGLETLIGRLVDAVPSVDPTLEGAARSTLTRMQHDLATLHGKVIQAAKRRDDTLRRQFARTRALAFPGGHPQEREIGFVSFLNQYGPALVERLLADLPLGLGTHWIVTI
jgi:bacillithiol biosynthesis cysteine-adding enzyme BshC